jgi:hypothetical protein
MVTSATRHKIEIRPHLAGIIAVVKNFKSSEAYPAPLRKPYVFVRKGRPIDTFFRRKFTLRKGLARSTPNLDRKLRALAIAVFFGSFFF